MQTFNFVQGTDEWLAHRAKLRNASEAPAMMGVNPYVSRQQLLHEKHTGHQREIDAKTQRVFDEGHRVEAAARPIADDILGQELYPASVADDDGWLGASLDGMTLDGVTIWECKQWNAEKAKAVDAGRVPECDYWQVVQQMLITGAEQCLYMVSDGTQEGTMSVLVKRAEVEKDFKRLIDGWKQFERDLLEYEPPESQPEAVGAKPESIPYLDIRVEGRVLATNLEAFREHAMAVIGEINTTLETDQDFADAEEAVKWCAEVESRLKSAKEAALAQTADIDALFKAIDDISETARQKRLSLDKLVKARKNERRQEIQDQAVEALRAHHMQIGATLTHDVRFPPPAEFRAKVGQAMKGKRTIQSLMDAAHQALTEAKLAANDQADTIRANLSAFVELAGDHEHLFPDLQQLAYKATDDFAAVVKARIAEAAEKERRLAEEKAQRETEAKKAAEEQERQEAEDEQRRKADAEALAGALEQQRAKEPAANAGELLTLGKINEALTPVMISAAGLAELGFEPHATSGASKLYPASQVPAICHTIAQHCIAVMRTFSDDQKKAS